MTRRDRWAFRRLNGAIDRQFKRARGHPMAVPSPNPVLLGRIAMPALVWRVMKLGLGVLALIGLYVALREHW